MDTICIFNMVQGIFYKEIRLDNNPALFFIRKSEIS